MSTTCIWGETGECLNLAFTKIPYKYLKYLVIAARLERATYCLEGPIQQKNPNFLNTSNHTEVFKISNILASTFSLNGSS